MKKFQPRIEGLEIRDLMATLTATAIPISAVEGAADNNPLVATFSDSDITRLATDFTATINYGDGTAPSTTGTIIKTGTTTYTVNDDHVFPEESGSVVPPGTFTVSVTIHDKTGGAPDSLSTSEASVSDASLHQGNPVNGGIPQQFTGGNTGNLTTATQALANFEAAIGGPNNGANPPPTPLTTGFRDINWDGVKLDGTDFGGGANTTVIDQGKTIGIPLNRFQERGTFFGAVYAVSTDTQTGGSFTDTNPNASGLFPAFTPHNTFAMFNDNGIDFKFALPASHTTSPVSAASRGFGAIFVNVEIPNTSFIEYFHNGTSLGKFAVPVGAKGAPVFLGVLFNNPIITDVSLTLGTDVIFNFDGTSFSSSGVVDNPGAGHNLVVTDDFVYAEPQAIINGFPIVDGNPGVSSAATIASATAGKSFTGVVGSFSDDDPNANAKDFTATINWGDGHTINGTIVKNANGGFDVQGTNTYVNGGLFSVVVDVMDFGGASTAVTNTIKVNSRVLAVGQDSGLAPEVKVYDPTSGALKLDFDAYDPAFFGGVHVATGDVNGDGVPDIITGAGQGGGPHVRVFDGATGAEIAIAGQTHGFFAYAPTFGGGVFVASGDFDGDGHADIVVSANTGISGAPEVEIFSGVDLHLIAGFNAYDPAFGGGVRIAVGNINGKPDIITAPGISGGPDIRVFDITGGVATKFAEFFAYDPRFAGGVFVAAGDVNGDGTADIITGAGAGGGPEVIAFDGKTLNNASPTILDSFFAFDPNFGGGVRVAAVDVNGDGRADIIGGAGPGGGPHVRVFDGVTGNQLLNAQDSFYAFDPTFSGGVFVGGQ